MYQIKGAKHEVDSNIFNVTIAEIMNEERLKDDMLREIKELKERLVGLERRKRESGEREVEKAKEKLRKKEEKIKEK